MRSSKQVQDPDKPAPLWNQYPAFSLNSIDGRVKFIEEYHDTPVEKVRDYWESIVVKSGFLALLSVANLVVLRRQDTL